MSRKKSCTRLTVAGLSIGVAAACQVQPLNEVQSGQVKLSSVGTPKSVAASSIEKTVTSLLQKKVTSGSLIDLSPTNQKYLVKTSKRQYGLKSLNEFTFELPTMPPGVINCWDSDSPWKPKRLSFTGTRYFTYPFENGAVSIDGARWIIRAAGNYLSQDGDNAVELSTGFTLPNDAIGITGSIDFSYQGQGATLRLNDPSESFFNETQIAESITPVRSLFIPTDKFVAGQNFLYLSTYAKYNGSTFYRSTGATAKARISYSIDSAPVSPSPKPTELTIGEIQIDNQIVLDQNGLRDIVIQDIAPIIKVKVDGDENTINSSELKLKFPTRSDGVEPAFSPSETIFDSSSKTFTYSTPFTENAALFPGDQFLDITVTTPSGQQDSKRIPFSVGERSLYSGGSSGSAYRLKATYGLKEVVTEVPEVTYEPEPVKRARELGKPVVKFNVKAWYPETSASNATRLAVSELPSAYIWVVRVSALASAALIPSDEYYFLDTPKASRTEEMVKMGYYRFDTGTDSGKPGVVDVDRETWRHINSNGHQEMSPTIIADSLLKLKLATQFRSDFELWNNFNIPSTRKPDLSLDNLLVVRYKGNLYRIVIQKRISDAFPRVVTGFVAGPEYTDKKTIWPTPLEQWSDVIDKIAVFSANANKTRDHKLLYLDIPPNDPAQPKQGIFVWQTSQGSPEYPAWILGELDENRRVNHRPLKPYIIDFNTKRGHAIPRCYILNLQKTARPIGPFTYTK